jgi:hypothetical protein
MNIVFVLGRTDGEMDGCIMYIFFLLEEYRSHRQGWDGTIVLSCSVPLVSRLKKMYLLDG